MKKTVNFRFSEDVLSKLEKLAEGSTRTAVLERLIFEAFQKSHKPVLEQKVAEAAEKVASWTKPPIDTPAAKRKTKPASPAPKLVGGETVKQRLARVDTRDAQERGAKPNVHRQKIPKPDWAVKPAEQRKINPMTGKPFGAVPK